ncbi:MAG: hypothetical protein ACHQ1D_04805 [Nitrososphaerales archaeon]
MSTRNSYSVKNSKFMIARWDMTSCFRGREEASLSTDNEDAARGEEEK